LQPAYGINHFSTKSTKDTRSFRSWRSFVSFVEDKIMIGIVVVSHSAKLAEGVCDLAGQMAQGQVRLAAAGGTTILTIPSAADAFRVQHAIESVQETAFSS
jgi:ABC-type polysaccharide/polyol phosphate transport system ATPase subunit